MSDAQRIKAMFATSTIEDLLFRQVDIAGHSMSRAKKVGHAPTHVGQVQLPARPRTTYVSATEDGRTFWYAVIWPHSASEPVSVTCGSEDEAKNCVLDYLKRFANDTEDDFLERCSFMGD